jgi:hypothetical protein
MRGGKKIASSFSRGGDLGREGTGVINLKAQTENWNMMCVI